MLAFTDLSVAAFLCGLVASADSLPSRAYDSVDAATVLEQAQSELKRTRARYARLLGEEGSLDSRSVE